MSVESTGKLNYFNIFDRKTDLCILLAIAFWFVAFFKGITTALDVWLTSDIFNHCLFVLPISFYLVWAKKHQLGQATPCLLFALPLFPLTLLYVVGIAGDITLFLHIATFAALPVIISSLIGWHQTKAILFPLCFILFAVPVGEELIPTLQQIAASIAIFILKLTQIPVYINGLYIEIPKGRFLVAEACSGISFFIVSIVFGSLFSYISFYSIKRKVAFVLISFLVPILANGIRVFGIIFIAHLTDMQYAAGADHLIYGWFFYCLVLLLLIVLGNWMRDEPITSEHSQKRVKPSSKPRNYFTITCICLLLAGQLLWVNSLTSNTPGQTQPLEITGFSSTTERFELSPIVPKADSTYTLSADDSSINTHLFIASFVNQSNGELVSGQQRLYSPQKWSMVRTSQLNLANGSSVNYSDITSPTGTKRLVIDWYHTKAYSGHSRIRTKLSQTYMRLFGRDNSGARVILSAEYESKQDKAVVTKLLRSYSEHVFKNLEQAYAEAN